MDINKIISPFIQGQFPEFYRSEGKNFVAFMRAYYEWMEQTNQTLGLSRSLLNTFDIDRTEEQFLKYFTKQYIANIPADILADKRLLVKYCLDLYRSKGSQRAVELLFRILFNEDIEVFTPGQYLLRPSDGKWFRTEYIEITSHPNLGLLPRRTIKNSTGSAVAVVESVFSKVFDGKTVNVVYLSNVRGEFKYNDRIVCDDIIEFEDAPIVIGSLSAIPIENGGFGFSVGDILDVQGLGRGGKARVAATRNEDGKVRFKIINGGSGYSVNATVTVATTINLVLNESNTTFANGSSIVDLSTNANGTVVFSNTSYVTLINFSSNLEFQIGSSVSDGNNSATIIDILGGGGSGADFRVGSLVNKEIYTLNSDIINDYVSTTIETQIRLTTSGATGAFTPGETITSSANTIIVQGTYVTANQISVNDVLANATLGIANLRVVTSDDRLFRLISTEDQLTNANLYAGAVIGTGTAAISLDRAPDKINSISNGVVFLTNSTSITANTLNDDDVLFIPGTTVISVSNNLVNATITAVERTTNWAFPSTFSSISNLDRRIDQVLNLYNLEVGTIATLSQVRPGSGYSSPPFIQVIQPDVALLGELDENGNIKGRNAIIDGTVSNESGIVTAVEVVDSGFGYVPNETLFLTKDTADVSVRGVSVVESYGRGTGTYLGTDGFTSEDFKIQDGDYYQIYSYEIISRRMKDTYERFVNDLVHPAGYKMFGRFRTTVQLTNTEIELIASNVVNQNTFNLIVGNTFISNIATFTRNSPATFINQAGVWEEIGNNQPRFNYSTSSVYEGLLMGPLRTNGVRNPRGVGANGPTLPTFINVVELPSGVTLNWERSVLNGLDVFLVTISGTPANTVNSRLVFEGTNVISAFAGQTWTGSYFHALISGSLTNLVLTHRLTGRSSSGTELNLVSQSIVPTTTFTRTSPLVTNLTDPSIVTVSMDTVLGFTTGAPVSVTLAFGAAQVERGAFATTPILPPANTTGSSTRQADTLEVNLADLGIRTNAKGTYLWAGRIRWANTTTDSRAIFSLNDGTPWNQILVEALTSGNVVFTETSSNSTFTTTSNSYFRVGMTVTGNGIARIYASNNTVNGSIVEANNVITKGLTKVRLSFDLESNTATESEILHFSTSPNVVSNNELVQLVHTLQLPQ